MRARLRIPARGRGGRLLDPPPARFARPAGREVVA